MPNTYAFPFKDIQQLESQPLNIRRYRFAINQTVSDYWSLVEPNPVNNPPFISNFPLDIRITDPHCTPGANWVSKDGTMFWSQVFSVFSLGATVGAYAIPNPLTKSGIYDFKQIYNIDELPSIGNTLSPSENSGSDDFNTFYYGGSIMYNPSQNAHLQREEMSSLGLRLSDTSNNGQNVLDVTNAFKGYARNIRRTDLGPLGYTCAFIMSGSCESTGPYLYPGNTNEANYIRDITDYPGSWKQRFFDTSSYITFKSIESTIQSMTTTGSVGEMSWRRSLPYKYLAADISTSNIVGITAQHTGASILNDLIFDSSKVNSLSQFFADASNGWTLGINESPSGEIGTDSIANASLNSPSGQPLSISCFNNSTLYNFVSYSGTTVRILSGSNTLFIPTSLSFTIPYFIRASGRNDSLSGYSLYTADTSSEPMIIRLYYPTSFGNKNILAIKYKTEDSMRFFGGINNIGIQVGSYIQISGATPPYNSNNKIYKVTAVYDGMPDDPSMKFNNGTSIYQAIELNSSLTISPDNVFPSVTISNVSSLPILHIKYTDS